MSDFDAFMLQFRPPNLESIASAIRPPQAYQHLTCLCLFSFQDVPLSFFARQEHHLQYFLLKLANNLVRNENPVV